MLVVITEFMDAASVAALEEGYQVVYEPNLYQDRDRLLGLLGEASALIVRNRTIVDGVLMASAPDLRLVARMGVGLDNIDLEEARDRGVEVRSTPGANANAVAEYVIGALLTLVRGCYTATGSLLEGRWPRDQLIGREASGLRLGLVGYGATARQVGVLARGLGMSISAHDPWVGDEVFADVERLGLSALFESVDAISVHVPLTTETRGMVGSALIDSIRPASLLVNTSRGGVVDEEAVVAALRSGRLGGAALDVFSEEPLTEEAGRKFAGVPNLILTPHIAGVTIESQRRIGEMTVAAVTQILGTTR